MSKLIFFKIIGALFIFSVSTLLWAQENTTNQFDDLLNRADKHKGASKVIFDSSIKKLSLQSDQLNPEQKEYLDYLLIFNQVYDGNYNQAIIAFESLFNQAKSTFVKVRTQSSLSNLYAFNRDYRSVFRALQYVTGALSEIEDKSLRNTIYLATANSYLLTDRYQLAREFAEVLLQDKPDEFKRCRALAYRQMADIELNNKPSINGQLFDEIFDLCRSQKQFVIVDVLSLRWYEYQFEQYKGQYNSQDLKELIAKVEKTCLEIDAQQFKSILTGKDALLARIHLADGDVNTAETYAKRIIKDAAELGDSEYKQSAYQVLETIARLQNNYALAYEYLLNRSRVERALMKDSLDKQVAFASVQHDVLAKELRIQQISQSNELLKANQELIQKESINQKLMMAWLLLLVGLLIFWIVRAIINRKKLETLVELDHLTKILNRKGLEDHVTQLLSRKAGQRKPVHLAIMDLDHFKQVNDQCGHLTGDWVLKYVIYHLKSVLVDGMILGRLGGEEFAVVGSGFDQATMLDYLEKMRETVQHLDYSQSEHPITLTASFGLASSSTAGYSLQMLLTQADLALYQAKNSGRNQVIVYRPDGRKTPEVPDSPE